MRMRTPTLKTYTLGSGTDLVLLHGFGFNKMVWHEHVIGLAKNYRLTLIDLPGYGDNLAINNSSRLDLTAQLILPHIPAKSILIGWSLGGLIALWLAHHYPKHLQQSIYIACNPCFIAKENWPGMSVNLFSTFYDQIKNHPEKTMRQFLNLQFSGCDNIKTLLTQYKTKLLNHLPATPTLLNSLKQLQQNNLIDYLTKSTTPTTFIFGQHDQLVPVNVADRIKTLNPNIEIKIIAQASHAPFLSHPDIFYSILEETLHANTKL